MRQKRLRIFAGPNGSGKSSIRKHVVQAVPLGCFINADEIEKVIKSGKGIRFSDFGIKTDTRILFRFFDYSEFVKSKSDALQLKKSFLIDRNILHVRNNAGVAPKYSAAIIAEFLREENLKAGNDFSFETVMSHQNKIDFIKKANRNGYHSYMYFICTDDVRVNIERIKTRVKEGGHSVPEDKIRTRYVRTLDLLFDALKVCYKSYLFDNSDKTIEIARIDRDKTLYFSLDKNKLPNWFVNSVLNKMK